MLVTAILWSRPSMPKPEAERYAAILQEEAKKHGFDPLVGVAIVHHESSWRPSVVSADGEDYGLGQLRVRFIGACRDDADPLGAPSDACKADKQRMLQAESNLRAMGGLIGSNIAYCKKLHKDGGATKRWLASYQGYNDLQHAKVCEPGPNTDRVLATVSDLEKRITRTGKLLPPAQPKPAPAATRKPAAGKAASKPATSKPAASPPAAKPAASKPASQHASKPLPKVAASKPAAGKPGANKPASKKKSSGKPKR